jgi:hypothetical protein
LEAICIAVSKSFRPVTFSKKKLFCNFFKWFEICVYNAGRIILVHFTARFCVGFWVFEPDPSQIEIRQQEENWQCLNIFYPINVKIFTQMTIVHMWRTNSSQKTNNDIRRIGPLMYYFALNYGIKITELQQSAMFF